MWSRYEESVHIREGGNCIQTRIKSRKQYNQSSSFSNNLMKRESFRALHEMGEK